MAETSSANGTLSSNTNAKTASKKCAICPSQKAIVVISLSLFIYLLLYLQPFGNYPKVIRKLLSIRHVNSNGTISPNIKGEVFLLILINSIPKTSSRRAVLRETWAGTAKTDTPGKSMNTKNSFNNNLQVFCVFLVGRSSNEKENTELEREAYINGDILRIDTSESYRNMIKKIWGGYRWASKIKPKYLMKVDDDIYLNIPHLITWIHKKSLPQKLYAGWVLHLGRIMRKPNNQWYVSYAQFHEHYYPDYCIGPFYLLSGDLIEKLIQVSLKRKMFNVEDAYLGVLMRDLKIRPLRINDLFVWDPSLGNSIPNWSNKQFRQVICLGERLDSKIIRLIHSKYQKIGFL
ncbi:beta-1,3-galactosyltransferase 5-like [Actinia tenebrosa]|uniref:Hexosyltransferase n=1 Tax=Actinia tenebrosa TaxID=6105 RepID=A0A6P8ILG4_ACTTE|nr:beta-1,3-galactosyltransferase 5-like [Actinia tenebrosa]